MTFRALMVVTSLLLVSVLPGCATKARTGAASGALIGGALGELVDDEGAEGLLVGAAAGGALGYLIGDRMDERDRRHPERGL